MDRADFLQMLVAQLRAQDPFNPVSNEDFDSQFATTYGAANDGTTLGDLMDRINSADGYNSGVSTGSTITMDAAGIIVARAASEANLGREITTQLLGYPRAIYVTSGVLALFAITSGMPMIPFLTLSGASFFLARMSANA